MDNTALILVQEQSDSSNTTIYSFYLIDLSTASCVLVSTNLTKSSTSPKLKTLGSHQGKFYLLSQVNLFTCDPRTGSINLVGTLASSNSAISRNTIAIDSSNEVISLSTQTNSSPPNTLTFNSVDTYQGKFSKIVSVSSKSGPVSCNALTFDSHDYLYGTFSPSPTSDNSTPDDILAFVYPSGGALTTQKIISITSYNQVNGLLFSNDILYGITQTGKLISIDPFSGKINKIGDTGLTVLGMCSLD